MSEPVAIETSAPVSARVARWAAVDCGGCGRVVYLPASWALTDYLCLRCRGAEGR